MKKKDVRIGMIVAMKVSGNVVPVKVVGIRTVSGFYGRDKTIYACVNQKTGRDCKAESAAKFRYEIKPKTELVHTTETIPFNEAECGGSFDGMSVSSDADSGL